MKRFISILCLLVGASVASYAGAISNATGTSLLGSNAALQTFDNATTFPINAYTSLPAFTLTNGTTNVNVIVSSSSTIRTGDPTTINTGGSFSVNSGAGPSFGPGLDQQYLSNYNFGGLNNPNAYARNLTLTFSTSISEFLIDYFGSDTSSNYYTINGLSTRYSLADQSCTVAAGNCATSGRSAGFVTDGTVTGINSVTFTFIGLDNDNAASAGDIVLFDDLRVVSVGGSIETTTSGGGTPNPGAIPEPSTYALMGAGLMAIAYARRKK